ncbi:hypothetical protein BAUCODRAFT_116964 [Baudoinia panamericana UAMH 10762]|uniref:Amidohydrolase-related domain-containing protein n=1 Tax=Baudoinia panamericana (strain UAMH 10762) TaxID=717646 RepID=M2LD45_BAUPA|nr:uncharacterized protein BAUCODRAFT_116964 [Baudoinia panamericana UAMH 10762]EMC91877.1 hypothetical protein BAUCODRAFT_116964 [Baudoinia panamericana UAMH 10762]
MVPPLITLEEHFISSRIPGAWKNFQAFPDHQKSKLASLDDERLRDIDAGSCQVQVLSHVCVEAPPNECRETNDELAAACRKHPKRFVGFATLPMAHPEAAADELERCVKQLGFVGALIDNHLEDGTFYDDEKFWPVFARAVKLDVPIYLHPTFASDDMMKHYEGNFSSQAALMMSIAGWGWHSETGLHILRLYASGLFDKYPKLKICVGHMGEFMPFALERCIRASARFGLERGLQTVWDENIWITTSGYFSLAPFACIIRSTKMDRIMYSVDYPFSMPVEGLKFVEEIQKSGLVSEEELQMICFKNAERFLGIKVEA